MLEVLLLFLVALCRADEEVAFLASYPRSGNTWTRRLVEAAVGGGRRTLSQYRDADAYVNITTASGLAVFGLAATAAPIPLVKTHVPKDFAGGAPLDVWRLSACRAVVLHRAPADSIESFIEYRFGADAVATADAEGVRGMARNWTAWHAWWATHPRAAYVAYADLRRAPAEGLARILAAAGLEAAADGAAVRRAVAAHPPAPERRGCDERLRRLVWGELGDDPVARRLGYSTPSPQCQQPPAAGGGR